MKKGKRREKKQEKKVIPEKQGSNRQASQSSDQTQVVENTEQQASTLIGNIKSEMEQTTGDKVFESEFPSFSAYLKRTYGQTYQYRQRETEPGNNLPGSGLTNKEISVETDKYRNRNDDDKVTTFSKKDKEGPIVNHIIGEEKYNQKEPLLRDHQPIRIECSIVKGTQRESQFDASCDRYRHAEVKSQMTPETYSPRSYESISPRSYKSDQYESLSPRNYKAEHYIDSNLNMDTHYSRQGNRDFSARKEDSVTRHISRDEERSPHTTANSKFSYTNPPYKEKRYRSDDDMNFDSSTFLSRSKESVYETSGLAMSNAESFNKQITKSIPVSHSKALKPSEHEDASPTINLLERGFDSMLDMKTCSSREEPRQHSPSPNRNEEANFSDTSRSRSRSRTKKKTVQSQVKGHKPVHTGHKSSPNIKIRDELPTSKQFTDKELGPSLNMSQRFGDQDSYEAMDMNFQRRNKNSNTDEQKLSDDFYLEDDYSKFGKLDYFDKEQTLHKSSPNIREIEQIYANVEPDSFVNLNNKYRETYPIEFNDQDIGMKRKHSHSKMDEMSEMFHLDKQSFRKFYVQNRVLDLKQEANQRGNYLNSPKYDSYSLEGEIISAQRKNMKSNSVIRNKNTSNKDKDAFLISNQDPLYPENYFSTRKSNSESDPTACTGMSSPAMSFTSSTDYCRSDSGTIQNSPLVHGSPTRISVGTQMQDFKDLKIDPQNPPKSRVRHKTLAYGVSGQDLNQVKHEAGNQVTDEDLQNREYFIEEDQRRPSIKQEQMLNDDLESEYRKLAVVNDDLLKIWEQAQAENTRLRLELSDVKNENETLKHQLGSAAKQVSQINAMTDAEKREKQIVVKKLAEMEEELKLLALSENLTDQTLDQLKSDNARLREENDALMQAMASKQK